MSLWAAQFLAVAYANSSALKIAYYLALFVTHCLALFVGISDCNVIGGFFWPCGMGPRRGASIDQPGLSLRGKSGIDKPIRLYVANPALNNHNG